VTMMCIGICGAVMTTVLILCFFSYLSLTTKLPGEVEPPPRLRTLTTSRLLRLVRSMPAQTVPARQMELKAHTSTL
jgi:hypothetical protein